MHPPALTLSTDDPFALLDLGHLSQQTGGDLSLQLELLDLFRLRSPELVDRMHALAATAQRPALCNLAHHLKGSALALGAFATAAAAETVERTFGPNSCSAQNSCSGDAEAGASHRRGEMALVALSGAVAEALAAIDAYVSDLAAKPPA
jgi:HPt (histidine-containing phosphotransfer) domain-containing protein